MNRLPKALYKGLCEVEGPVGKELLLQSHLTRLLCSVFAAGLHLGAGAQAVLQDLSDTQ